MLLGRAPFTVHDDHADFGRLGEKRVIKQSRQQREQRAANNAFHGLNSR
jgi:hypothetical protein